MSSHVAAREHQTCYSDDSCKVSSRYLKDEGLVFEPPVIREYYFSDMLNKRGVEDAHVLLWMIKDFAWIRIWDYRLIATIGVLATGFSLGIFFWDVLDVVKCVKSRSRALIYESVKECINSCGALIWLAANCWWAVGENWDLAHTGGYNDVYERFADQASYVLWVGCFIILNFWIANWAIESLGLSKTAYKIRLLRHARHKSLIGEQVKYDIPYLMGIEDFRKDCQESVVADSVGFEESNTEGFCRAENPSRDSIVISGMPYQQLGFVGIPRGCQDFISGERSESKRFRFVNEGLFSFRDFENYVTFFWIWKDISWYYEEPTWARILWCFNALMALLVSNMIVVTLARHFKKCKVCLVDVVHAFASTLWIICNVMWAFGEMFITDEVDNLPDDPAERIHILVPPLFTPFSDLPPGPWLTRWISGWMLLASMFSLILFYLCVVVVDVKTYMSNKRDARSSAPAGI
eukprot:GHVH01008276.1.p1 GENE.GHVH01008276.1~~GHVH01008276.1.p1  ORF type:complete len:464 (+),score=47.53 GHVH01008276.1:321-1712(+)